MASSTNGIITRGEIIAHYNDTKYWVNNILPTTTSDNQAATAAWIDSKVNSPAYVWTYSSSYTNKTKCVKYAHVIGTSAANDFIRFNKYQMPVQVEITASGGQVSGTWQLMISPNSDDTSVSNRQVYLQMPTGIDSSTIASGSTLVKSRNDGWGNEIAGNVSSSFTVALTGSSVSGYYSTVTIPKKLLTKPATLKFIIQIKVGSGSQPLSLGSCSLILA